MVQEAMSDSDFFAWLREVRCVTVKEAAERLGIAHESARGRLKRLERRGVLTRKMAGRVAVYCVREGAQLPPPPLPFKPPGPGEKTRRRMEKALELVAREGCVTTPALCRALNVGSSQVKHVMRHLLAEGRVVEAVLGKTALWCRDRAAAEGLIRRLKDVAHRLAASNGFRYVTPSKILRAAQMDKEAYALFSRFIPLSRFAGDRLHPVALSFVDSILASLYGEPVIYAPNRHVYFAAQPRQGLGGIVIRSGADVEKVEISLPDDLADALRGADAEEVVKQAIKQLLERYT